MSQEFDEISKRIRTLTAILQSLKARSDPTSHHREIPRFLSHFVTLLTCGDPHSPTATKVVAATGRFERDGTARTLIVTQNARSKSPTSTLSVKKIPKVVKSFQDVVNGTPDAKSLQDHIADVWVALETYDRKAPDAIDNYDALGCFLVTRSFRKLAARFQEDKRFFRDRRLFEVIQEWKPDEPEKLTPRWVPAPQWLHQLAPALMPEGCEREVGGQVQWKVSNETLSSWARLLVMLLKTLGRYIQSANAAMKSMGSSLTEDQRFAIFNVHTCCGILYQFVSWDQRVVQFLLEDTSLARHLQSWMHYVDTNNEDEFDLIPELKEGASTIILRYLKAVVAWHAALDYLTARPFVNQVATNLLVGLVEVLRGDSSMLTADELIKMYESGLDSEQSEEDVKQMVHVLGTHYISSFPGTVHAEATLMGLLAYVNHNQHCNYGSKIEGENLLGEFLGDEESTIDAIVVTKKCCWCCERLAMHLEHRLNIHFTLPGTHGLLYAWSPPAIGVDVSVLADLEKDLWSELRRTLELNVVPVISRQSSGSSDPALESTSGRGMILPADIVHETLNML